MIRWTHDEILFLEKSVGPLAHREIAGRLGRSLAAVRTKIMELGLTDRTPRWTPAETRHLLRHWPDPTKRPGVVAALGRSHRACVEKFYLETKRGR